MEKITIGFMHFFVYYVVREMGGEKWKKLTFFHKGKIQTYNNITKYAKFSNVFCVRTERGKIHEKSTGSFLLGKALCLCFVCDFQSLK